MFPFGFMFGIAGALQSLAQTSVKCQGESALSVVNARHMQAEKGIAELERIYELPQD